MNLQKNLQGTWPQALATFLLPLVAVLALRWAVVEPFVIPSASMLPNLKIHDHILVKKFAYGLRVPFANHWILRWGHPQAGEISVFRYPEDPQIYYIKRIIGLPGDSILVRDGRVHVNGEEKVLKSLGPDEEGLYRFQEQNYLVQFRSEAPFPDALGETFQVPAGHYFVLGDNRDFSADSRVWGFVPEKLLVGPAWLIWLSCEKTLPTMKFLCDPSQIRWERLFKKLDKPISAP